MFLKYLIIVLYLCSYIVFAAKVQVIENSSTVDSTSESINQPCIDCHKSQSKSWLKSDHSKSMAIANSQSVIADFGNVKVEHYGQKALFFIDDNSYQVTISYDNKSNTYPIKFTFGFFPLQQYLVETEKGKLQVLPFAWDSRKKKLGGQRWYHNYSHEEITPEDRLHWKQPLQNWNGMCADCHSDGLTRNYNQEKNRFNTQYKNINVGCLSCHGDMSTHQKTYKQNAPIQRNTILPQLGQWVRNVGNKTAHWQGDKRDNSFMDNCFACHSLRAPLTDGFEANKPFLDQFTPQLPAAPNYHADGQIKEEVYVYGSFLQSKMHAAGVNCLDCHDSHTMKLKIEGNGLCLQCHSNEAYNSTQHHGHKGTSTGAQCVNCHMPESRYMGVDDRRDHSFKLPRPDLSEKFQTPNACIKCHESESNQWASENLEQWHGKHKPLPKSKLFLMLLNNSQAINLAQHWLIINDESLDIINRASALQRLGLTTQTIKASNLQPYLSHKEPLLRMSAANASVLLPSQEKEKYLSPLLNDARKAVRVAAARVLISTHVSLKNKRKLSKAINELFQANAVSSWRGEGQANQALIALELNNLEEAEQYFTKAINIDPYFVQAYINLADIYQTQKQNYLVKSTLDKGLMKLPNSGVLHYSLGLYFVRQQNLNKAFASFKKAMNLSPNNTQFAYTYILALDGLGKSQLALDELKVIINDYQDKTLLVEMGLYLSQKLKSKANYDFFIKL